MAFPIFAAALLSLEADRRLGAHVFDAANGGPILWQHLFWFFGHPEVYIIALPFFGIITEILPVFARKPIFGYMGLVGATLMIAALSVAVWAHHMFVTGSVDLAFFSFMTFLIAVPTGVKFFNWIGTMWGGSLSFDTPLIFSLGFLTTFLFGGLTGVILASPTLDFQLSDSYFVVAHFHYVVFGTVVFAMFAGFYFWWPKFTGRMLDEKLGKVHFWLLFIGFHMTFLVQHWLGVEGFPRRYADYSPTDGFTTLNKISSIGAFLLGASTLPFFYNVWKSRKGPLGRARRPVGLGPLARVGDLLAAAASQLRLAAAHPFREPGVRPAPPGDREARAAREPGRDVTVCRRARRRGQGRGSGTDRPHRRRQGRSLIHEGRVLDHHRVRDLLRDRRTRLLGSLARPHGHVGVGHDVPADGPAGLLPRCGGQADPDRPEDRSDGEIADGAGEQGFFPPYSWWPLFCASALAVGHSSTSVETRLPGGQRVIVTGRSSIGESHPGCCGPASARNSRRRAPDSRSAGASRAIPSRASARLATASAASSR